MLTIENPNKFDWRNISLPDCIEGNCYDTHFTLKLYEVFKEKLKGDERWFLYENLISPASDTFVDMEFAGVDISPENLKKVGKIVRDHNIEKEDEIYSMPEVDITKSLTSPKDQSDILFLSEENRSRLGMIMDGIDTKMLDQPGFGLYPPEFTDKNVPTCKKAALETILSIIEDELNKRKDA